jgi:phosphatidate phosphatase PAH1
VTGAGAPRHSAGDAIVATGANAPVAGKFAYGKVSKDLEDETVTLWLGETSIASALTDGDGRARFEVPARLLRPGANRFRIVVAGDLSHADGAIWVLAPGAKVVVLDIDGTLTTGDSEIVEYALLGDEVAARDGAVELTRYWRDAGAQPIYLTGRPYPLVPSTRAWLARHGFADGPLAGPDRLRDALPTDSGVGEYKQAWLADLRARTGVAIAAAYGNAATDVCAFARAGLDPETTFIWGAERKACDGSAPAQAVADYRAHVDALRAR